MKKFIIALLLTACLPVSALNYWPTEEHTFTVIARGGYDFIGRTPIINGGVGASIGWLKLELEIGGTQLTFPDLSKYNLPYAATMCGFTFGDKHSVYAMIGITNWALIELNPDNHSQYALRDAFRGKIKIGCNFLITKNLIFNIDFSGICPHIERSTEQHCYRDFSSLFLSAGLGFKI